MGALVTKHEAREEDVSWGLCFDLLTTFHGFMIKRNKSIQLRTDNGIQQLRICPSYLTGFIVVSVAYCSF